MAYPMTDCTHDPELTAILAASGTTLDDITAEMEAVLMSVAQEEPV
jgi:hypothetical protein